MTDIIYKIASSLIPGIGPVRARSLISYLGSPEAIFKESKSAMAKIPGIGSITLSNIDFDKVLEDAQVEAEKIEKNNIKMIFYLDADFPKKLNHYDDLPIILYIKGEPEFNRGKVLSIVGTRSMTHYGQHNCEMLISDLAKMNINVTIISGLAYGVDYTAHTSALTNNLKTFAILGHGLNQIYPAAHAQLAKNIEQNGALISEYSFNTKPDQANFVRRNRIIAALSDATIVIETARKGGSLITAEYAVGYSSEVFTFPGRVGDKMSEGCNFLIKTNRAGLIENAEDLISMLGWEQKKLAVQTQLFVQLTENEQKIVDLIKKHELINIDVISYETNIPINNVMALLFNLEFNNIVKALPGRMYKLI